MTDRPILATYRLQLGAGFGFREATDVLDQLVGLGVSHVYTSPVLDAVPGSTHGYDVVDHHRPNDELGGEEGFRNLVDAAHERGLGLVLDVVPNHMATHPHNTRWWDVLRFGRASAYACWFDIDWEHGSDETPDRLLLAVLADHYGVSLRDGRITLDVLHDSLVVRVADLVFPLSVPSVMEVLRAAANECGDEAVVAEIETLANGGERAADHSDALRRLSLLSRCWHDDGTIPVRDVLARWNADPEQLHHILEQQHYRLAHWSTGAESLDYRRFFDVSTLIGMRIEDPQVFESVHSRTLQWVAHGDVDGLRIDHPDGLTDPTGYLQTLRAHAPLAWIVVEKILAHDETLPASWPVDGTTGYETLNLLDRVFVDPAGEAALTAELETHTGIADDFATVRRRAKEDVLHQILLAEVHRLAHDLIDHDRALLDRVDMSAFDAGSVIGAFLIEMPVYRTYTREGARADDHDAALVEQVRAAVHARGAFDPAIVDLVADVLIGPLESEAAIRFRRRFQQTSGPVMAKGVEDTAFYRYPRLVSLNEVGGDPTWFGVGLDDFHAQQLEAVKREPLRMVTTSTHDTKRSEDVRARIAVLSEVPDDWARAMEVFASRAAALGTEDRDPVLEYLLHQTIVGAHPISTERIVEHAIKASREAKRRTSWLHPDEAHESALVDSVTAWLRDEEYVGALARLLDVVMVPGRVNALAQKLVAMTIPGVPDLYQGSELWTGAVVDPDNRRPVDFELRREMHARALDAGGPALDLLDEGASKLHVVRAALHLRRRHPEAFAPGTGSYEPLHADGDASDHVVAFVRGDRVATIVPRMVARLGRDGGWRATRITLPPGRWSDVISGHGFDGSVAVADLFVPNAIALLERA